MTATDTHPRLATCRGCRQDITTEERKFARITVNGRVALGMLDRPL